MCVQYRGQIRIIINHRKIRLSILRHLQNLISFFFFSPTYRLHFISTATKSAEIYVINEYLRVNQEESVDKQDCFFGYL